jgi:predicted ester cyclase
MTAEEMEALRECIGQAWTEGRSELLDEVYGPGFINRSNGQDCEATKKVLVQYREAFSDLDLTADDVIIAGDKIVVRGTTRTVHTGP